jgi:hypothetical protein
MSPYNLHSDTLLTSLLGQVWLLMYNNKIKHHFIFFQSSSDMQKYIIAACPCNCLESFGGWFKCSVEDCEAWIYPLCSTSCNWLDMQPWKSPARVPWS